MGNRRKLKKNINKVMDLLYTDCILYRISDKNADKKAVDEIVAKLVEIHKEYISRISTSEGKFVKGRVKSYYKKLRTDFNNQINVIIKEISQLS